MGEAAAIVFAIIGIYVFLMLTGIHTVTEGHVGIYKNYGVLSPKLSEPGIHFMIPFITSMEEIQTSIQTDAVTNIPCGTSGGTLIFFDSIEVVNRLRKDYVFATIKNYTSEYDKLWIYNKIHHEINEFCSKYTLSEIYIQKFEYLDEELKKALQNDLDDWAPGVEVISIRITKPRIPERIRSNFEKMEQVKVESLISSERQNVIKEREMTEQKKAIISAESKLDVRVIELEKEISLKQNNFKLAHIEALIYLEKLKAEIDASFLGTMKELELYPTLYSKEALQMEAVRALTENITLVLGSNIPNIVTKIG